MSDRFVLPGFRAKPADCRAAISRLNTVKLTTDKFEAGWGLR